MKTLQGKIAVMQAFVDGKDVEVRRIPHQGWVLWSKENGEPKFDWANCDYRVKEDQEMKAYNLWPGGGIGRTISSDTRQWMRNIINAVKAGDIT